MATQTIAHFNHKHADSKRGKDSSRETIRRQRRARQGERLVLVAASK